MRTIKLIIAYDGTDYCGWQRQDSDKTKLPSVQGVIEKALEKIHKHSVPLTGSGRTDSGVHAAGQAANFITDIESIKVPRFVRALNGILPQDIRILHSSEVPEGFHSRYDTRSRTYRYNFICGRLAMPHESRYALQLFRQPKIDLLNSYCRLLPGERDCSVFASSGDKSLSRSRYIYNALFFMEDRRLVFEITANAFLWKMVRSIAGTFIHHEEKNTPPEQMKKIIASGQRELAGPTLPPRGLFLWKVEY